MIGTRKLDRGFLQEVLAEPGGEHLTSCSPCGTCVATCPVPYHDPHYNPRLLFHKISLGMRDEVLSSTEIWQCSECDNCYPRCPHQIHISDVMKAIRNVAMREGYQRPGPTAAVNVARCTACGMCATACPYEAISLETVQWNRSQKRAAQVHLNLCLGCGMCSAICPSASISVEGQTDAALHSLIATAAHAADRQARPSDQPTLLVAICQWSLRREQDVDYITHPPEGVQCITVPCSSRVSPAFITSALRRGADGILVVGCQEEECHYKHGNLLERQRVALMQSMLDLLGIERERVQFATLGALERGKLPYLVSDTLRALETIGPAPESVTGEAVPSVRIPVGVGAATQRTGENES